MDDDVFTQNPYPLYDLMREKGDVYWNDDLQIWIVLGYDAVRFALTDQRFSVKTVHYLAETTFPRNKRDCIQPLIDYLNSWMLYQDPPEHTAMRRPLAPAFSQEVIKNTDHHIQEIVSDVCSSLTGECNFMDMVAGLIPSRMMARFLSISEEDAKLYVDWTVTMSEFFDAQVRTPYEYEPALKALAAQQKKIPSSLTGMLLGTGIETTMTFLGNGLYLLLKNPALINRLREHPALLEAALNEFLRFEPPVHETVRQANADVLLGNELIKKGDMVRVYLAAANRDPRIFVNPHELNIDREPIFNCSFGFGIHYCLGRLLGKSIAHHTIAYLLEHYSKIALLEEPLWHRRMALRRLASLKIIATHY